MLRSRSHGIISFYLLLSIFPPDASGFSQDVPIRALVRPLIRPPYTRIHLSFISIATPPPTHFGENSTNPTRMFQSTFFLVFSLLQSASYISYTHAPRILSERKKRSPETIDQLNETNQFDVFCFFFRY